MNKRTFIKSSLIGALGTPFTSIKEQSLWNAVKDVPAQKLAFDNDFWLEVRKGFRLKSDYINLENGYYLMMPEVTLARYIQKIREVNYHASWYMRREQFENKKKSVAALAKLAGCQPDELIITRNTTESLDMVIAGQDWKPGDEAVMALQDYGAMLNQFKMMEQRFGIVNRIISLPNHPRSDDEIVDLYATALNDKTKLLMICHMVNITGQILPVKKICEMAHKKGVKVMVDGAHAFAHLDYKISDLGCDFYGTSLHKWLSVPLGAGFLYVKKESIPSIWPLFSADKSQQDYIGRLNHTGTHPVATDLAIMDAIDYHEHIGIERKESRLRYLQQYWTGLVRDLDKIMVNTPKEPSRHCALGNVGVQGIKPADLAKELLETYKIWTVAIDYANVQGVRITPHLYTKTGELDQLADALKKISEQA